MKCMFFINSFVMFFALKMELEGFVRLFIMNTSFPFPKIVPGFWILPLILTAAKIWPRIHFLPFLMQTNCLYWCFSAFLDIPGVGAGKYRCEYNLCNSNSNKSKDRPIQESQKNEPASQTDLILLTNGKSNPIQSFCNPELSQAEVHSSNLPPPSTFTKGGGLTSSNLAIRVGMKYFF